MVVHRQSGILDEARHCFRNGQQQQADRNKQQHVDQARPGARRGANWLRQPPGRVVMGQVRTTVDCGDDAFGMGKKTSPVRRVTPPAPPPFFLGG